MIHKDGVLDYKFPDIEVRHEGEPITPSHAAWDLVAAAIYDPDWMEEEWDKNKSAP